MKNYVLIGPWRVVSLQEMLMVMEILREIPSPEHSELREERVNIN